MVKKCNSLVISRVSHIAVWIIDRVFNITIFQIITHLFDCHLRTIFFCLCCRSSQMRNDNSSLYTCNLWCREVSHVMLNLTGYQSIYHSFTVHQHISGKVQYNHAIFHQTDSICIDHALCTVKCRYMNRNIITFTINLIHSSCMVDSSGDLPCRLH